MLGPIGIMKRDLWQKIPQRGRKWALWIAGILLFYGIVGSLVLPPIARHVAVAQLSKQLGRDVAIDTVRIHPFDCSVTVRGLSIKDPDGTPFLSWDTVHVNFQLLSLFGKAYTFKEISTTKPAVHVRVNADGTFNFSDILQRFSTNTAPAKPAAKSLSKPLAVRIKIIRADGFTISLDNHLAMTNRAAKTPEPVATATSAINPTTALLQSITNAFAQIAQSTNLLQATVDNVLVTNGAIHFEDVTTSRPAKLDLTEITLLASDLSNAAGAQPVAVLNLRWNENGAITITATPTFSPPTANVTIDISRLDFGTLDPYLEPKLDLFILGSRLGLRGIVSLDNPTNQLPEISFRGDLRLDGLRTVDGVMAEDLLKWDSLRVSGIDARLRAGTEPFVAINKIALDNLFARLVIETNKTINLLNALRLTSTNAPATNEIAVAGTSSITNASLPKIRIDAIIVTNAQISFADRSLSPNVNLHIEQAGGIISNLSSEQLQHGDVDLHAAVDGIGPVAITGTINPFSGTLTNHITVAVKDVDLTPTGPYSAKFAGYRIAEGKLNLDLEYELVGKKLSSKNVITLDQFTFGEQVDSPDATHLPVRLAIAILKDRNGKIILDVPVEGSLDDPKFRVGKVVTRAILNILEKVATSPFALVGAIFGGGGEELGYQEFAPGDATLTADDIKKLDVLAKALYERPGLQMEIIGSIDPAADREGLQRIALDKQIRTLVWMNLRKSQQATNSVKQVIVTPDQRENWVRKLYAQAVADGKVTPQLLAADTNLAVYAAGVLPKIKSLKGATQLVKSRAANGSAATAPVYQTKLVPPPSPTEAVLLATLPVNDNDLEALAASRTAAVQNDLLQTGKVDASRLFLKAGTVEGLRRDGSRVYLQFR